MGDNRVIQGRMMTPKKLAQILEDGDILEATEITDADESCPDCGGNVVEVGYMPDATSYRVAKKCQDCDWGTTED